MVCRDVLRIRLNCWSDVARLQVGNGGLNATEDLSHFSMWCMLAAPLLAGNDLSSMTPAVLSVLTHEELIAVCRPALFCAAFLFRLGWLRHLAEASISADRSGPSGEPGCGGEGGRAQQHEARPGLAGVEATAARRVEGCAAPQP